MRVNRCNVPWSGVLALQSPPGSSELGQNQLLWALSCVVPIRDRPEWQMCLSQMSELCQGNLSFFLPISWFCICPYELCDMTATGLRVFIVFFISGNSVAGHFVVLKWLRFKLSFQTTTMDFPWSTRPPLVSRGTTVSSARSWARAWCPTSALSSLRPECKFWNARFSL